MIKLINGNTQSAGGVLLANGSIVLQLTADARTIAAPGYVVASIPVTFRFDSSGNLLGTCQLWSNAELSGQTQYQVNFYDQNNSRVGSSALWQFDQAAGSTVDIGTMVSITPGGASVSFPFGKQTQTSTAAMSFLGTSFNSFEVNMTTNVTSSSFTGSVPGIITFKFIQDNTGGRTFAWPSNVLHAEAPDTSANAISVQSFYFDGTNAYPTGAMTVN